MGVTWDLHRRIIGRTRKEDASHFLGKMKKGAVFAWVTLNARVSSIKKETGLPVFSEINRENITAPT